MFLTKSLNLAKLFLHLQINSIRNYGDPFKKKVHLNQYKIKSPIIQSHLVLSILNHFKNIANQ